MLDLSATISMPPSLPLQYDEYCDFVGGLSWLDYRRSASTKRLNSVSKLECLLTSFNRYLYDEDQPQRLALERLFVKLSMLIKLSRIIHDSHTVFESAVNNINPLTVRVGLSAENGIAPCYWNYQLAMGFMDVNLPSLKGENAYYAYPQAFNRNMGPECDAYSLGIMLFRALLVNKRQGIETVCYVIETMSKRIGEITQSHTNLSDSTALVRDIYGYLSSTLSNRLFDQNNICYFPNFNIESFISANTWHKLLVLGFRLITQVPGFSYCCCSDKQGVQLWSVTGEIVNDLAAIAQEVKRCLFYAPSIIERDFKKLLYEVIDDPVWLASLGDIAVDENLLVSSVNGVVDKNSNMIHETIPSYDDLDNTVIISNNGG